MRYPWLWSHSGARCALPFHNMIGYSTQYGRSKIHAKYVCSMELYRLLWCSQTLPLCMHICLQFDPNIVWKSCNEYKTGLVFGLTSRHTTLTHTRRYTNSSTAQFSCYACWSGRASILPFYCITLAWLKYSHTCSKHWSDGIGKPVCIVLVQVSYNVKYPIEWAQMCYSWQICVVQVMLSARFLVYMTNQSSSWARTWDKSFHL